MTVGRRDLCSGITIGQDDESPHVMRMAPRPNFEGLDV